MTEDQISIGEKSSDMSTMSDTPSASGDSPVSINHVFSGDRGMKNNLIVNYLPPNMTQEEVRSLFSSIGDVESCKLVRDKNTGESLGYAFVKYVKGDHAERAVNTLNGLRLQSKTIKVSFARPSSDNIKGANLYICGLPKKMNQRELEILFSQCGKIITARILYENKSGLSRGVAFIRFDQRTEAEAAIHKFNGFKPEGCPEAITVKFANSPSAVTTKQSGIGPGFPKNNFAISNHAIQAAVASTSASNSGTTTSAAGTGANALHPFSQLHQLPNMSHSSKMRHNSHMAISGASPSPVAGVDLFANNPVLTQAMVASCGGLTNKGWCIFVCNLSPEMEEAELWKLFGPFGAVQNVKMIKDPTTQKCKGFGFVTMSNYEEALLAIHSLNNFVLSNRVLQVSFKTAGNGKTHGNLNCRGSSLSSIGEM